MANGLTAILEKYGSVVLFDVETSGLNPYKDQIIELAAQKLYRKEDGLYAQELHFYIKLYDGHQISKEAQAVNHISETILMAKGVSIEYAISKFKELIGDSALLVAHNANFDMLFASVAALKVGCLPFFQSKDVIDTLTVFKDRAPYPHRLENAIHYYHLEGTVQNSHGAADDTRALLYVFIEMAKEKDDLLQYVNLFGYNPKYPPEYRLKSVRYKSQPYNSAAPIYIEPSIPIPRSNSTNATPNTESMEVCPYCRHTFVDTMGYCPECISLSMRGRNALRNSPISEKDFEIDLSQDGWVIKKYCGFDKKMLRIPSVIDGKKIVEIGENAFCNLHAIQYVSVDSGIISIGKEAFCCCSSLRQIFLPDTLRYICEGAFSNCVNLYDAALPNTITHIGEEAFFCCYPLYNIDLQNTAITTIPQHVFFNCNIKRLIFPKRLTSIMPITFGTWMIRPWDAVEIPFYPSPIVIPDGVTSLADNSFNINFSQNPVDIYIPKSVTSIQPKALRVYHSNYPLTVHCERGSEALRYAREYGLGAVEWERSGENIPYPHEIPTINEVRKEILKMQKRTKDMQYQEAMRYQHDLSYGDESDYL